MRILFITGITILLLINNNLFSQQNNISPEERRARIVEAYNRQMQLKSEKSGASEDPLPNALTKRSFTGQYAGDLFGASVSNAGDVNGDGYADIIIGAIEYPGETAVGNAYIYFGGPTIDYVPDLILSGEADEDEFGWCVSFAGDMNGDGFDDVVVSAVANDSGGTNSGRVYIFFGGSPMNNVADVILTGESADDLFGRWVSYSGDVNGDGYSDVIVSAPYNDEAGTDAGKAYIYFGGSVVDNIPDLSFYGETAGDNFGLKASTAGDINGDGFGDVIISSPFNNSETGKVYIYFGSSSMDNIADLEITGILAGDSFGSAATMAGDVNGDGYSDIIIGAAGAASLKGEVYIYFGGSPMDDIVDVTFSGETSGDSFGLTVALAGDVNGDGFDDVIVGSLSHASLTGRAYIFFGGIVPDNIPDIITSGEATGDRFGCSVSTAGDINGDGYCEFLVGAYGNDANGTDAGKAYLYFNSLTGPDIPDEFFSGENNGDELGYSVANAGDVNGDGYDDIIVGAPFYDDVTYTNNGIAYIYFGGPELDNIPDVTLIGDVGTSSSNFFGYSVSGVGDINGDGFDDVIVGSPFTDFNGNNSGTISIFLGGNPMSGIRYNFIDGPGGTGEQFGISLSDAGDVNSDGYNDFIIGAPGSGNIGRSYIYFGGSSVDNTADIIMTGESDGDFFGNSVSTAGDVNGDGYSDVIVGASGNDEGGTNAGRAYIFLGDASMDNTADVIMTGAAANDLFGYSVSAAEDVNGDGYSDVIVGAYQNSAGGSNAGRAYIYFGGSSMDNIADIIMTGAAAGDDFGNSVSTAGDVNGDGYSDVIVGALVNSAGGPGAGRAYIYFGDAGMDNTADLIMTGEAAGDYFGNSVSTAGDVNGDGYSDVIVGANYNDAGGTDAGRAYLYLSSSPPIKPRIMSVKDVPFDQGGQVKLKWVRSGYDIQGISKITDYLIQRSFPPDENGFSWENIVTMPASNEPFYSYISETPNDSMTSNSGTYYFRITARTSDPNEYWRSNIIYGHSVDNLAPLAPMGFYTQQNSSEIHLGWQANTEPDLRDYYVYRSDTPLARDFTLLGTTTDTSYTDSSPPAGNAYYYLQAYDIHDNGSLFSTDSITALLSANIKVFLEGPYSSGVMSTTLNTNGYLPLSQPYNTAPWNYTGTESVASIPADVVDWVLLELRSDITTQVARRAAFIKNDGSLVDLDGVSLVDFASVPGGSYYLVIYHRNHLQIMTANPVELSSSPTLYDLTTSSTQAYGTDPMKDLGGGVFGMYSGDTNNSGIVTASDKSLVNSFNLNTGYYNADTNFSGIVTAADKTNINSNNLKQEFVP